MKLLVEQIGIKWDGPFTKDNFHQLNTNSDYGIYQIYGAHSIYGINTLLYIGKAQEQKFNVRILQHLEWIKKEISDPTFYIGRIGCAPNEDESEIQQHWGKYIDTAEKLLIHFCAPAYNTSNLNQYGEFDNIVILNLGKKMLLPYEVSTLYYKTNFWERDKWIDLKDEKG